MKTATLSLLAHFFIFLLPLSKAQEDDNSLLQPSIRFERLTTEDGLSNLYTQDILQDSRGFIWIATQDGLNRYDGHDFKVYRHDPDDPYAIGDNDVFCLHEDRTGTLWVGLTSAGVERFDPVTERFTHYRHSPDDSTSLSDNNILDIIEDKLGNLWIATFDGFNKFNPGSKTFSRYQYDSDDPQGVSDELVTRIFEDHKGQLWVGGIQGFQKFDPITGLFSPPYVHDSLAPNTLSNNDICVFFEDRDNVFWIGTADGLNRFDRETGRFTRYKYDPDDPTSLSGKVIFDIHEDKAGNFWIGTDSGLNLFDRKTGKAIRYTSDPNDETTLAGNRVRRIYEDSAGILWVVGYQVTKFEPYSSHFKTYRPDSNNANTLNTNFVTGIHESSEGIFWITTELGKLSRFDSVTQQFAQFIPDTVHSDRLPELGSVEALSGNETSLWLATFGSGVLQFDIKTEEFIHYMSNPNAPNSLSYSYVMALLVGKAGQVWLGTQVQGLDKYNPQRDKFTNYSHNPDDPSSLSGNQVHSIYEDSQGYTWVGTWGSGLNKFIQATEGFIRYPHNPDDLNSLSNNRVVTIYEDNKGQLWIGTGGGLNTFNPQTETFTHYFEKDGLANASVQSLVEDNQGYLWLGTKKGLTRFDPKTETFRNYDVRDGLPSNEFAQNAVHKSRRGELLFGTSDGLLVFNPEKITDNPHIPSVILTDFQLFNRSVPITGTQASLQAEAPCLTKAINELDEIKLNYDQSVISFRFSALNYRASEKNQYAFQMEGFDEDWNYVDSKHRVATYTNLDPGAYIFRVIASNNDGLWNKEGKEITVYIQPPWWSTWWFQVAVVFLVGFMAIGTVKWRIQRLKNQKNTLGLLVLERTQELKTAKEAAEEAKEEAEDSKEVAERANRAKSAFLANMSHELRTPLNAILGFSNLMRRESSVLTDRQQENLDIIYRSGEHLLTLINSVLDLSKLEAGRSTLNLSNFDLYQLLDDLVDMFSLKANEKKLQILLERAPDVPRYIRADEQKLRQVFINLIGNSLKFTDQGGVVIRARSEPENIPSESHTSPPVSNVCSHLYFEVEDTGTGIAADELESVFKAFTQTATGRLSTEGTGLGMTISREFIILMGGILDVRSVVNKGTTFFFTIKIETVSEADLQQNIRNRQVTGLEPEQPCYRILVVDDNAVNRRLLVALLQSLGFDIKEATNGQEAVELHTTWQPHLIWMDIRMPVMDGKEATRIIKSSKDGKKTKIMALTASSFEEERADIMASGCDDFFRKPLKEDDIFEAMHHHLGVEYIYEEPKKISPTPGPREVLTVEKLNALPEDLLKSLEGFVVRARVTEINQVLEEIRSHDEGVVQALQTLADDFQYAEILGLIRTIRDEQ